jgi:hypothetical protein
MLQPNRLFALTAATVFGITWTIGAAAWTVGTSSWHWSTRVPDVVHTYGIRLKGGQELFFTPHLGWFLDNSIGICFALLVVTVLVDKFSRYGARSA